MNKTIYQAAFWLILPLLLLCTSCAERRNGYQVVGVWEGEDFKVEYRDTTLMLSPRFIFVPDSDDPERGEVEVRGSYDMFTVETDEYYATHAEGPFLMKGTWWATKDGVTLSFTADDVEASLTKIALVDAPADATAFFNAVSNDNKQTKVVTSKEVAALLSEFLDDESEEADIRFKEGDCLTVLWNGTDWPLRRD